MTAAYGRLRPAPVNSAAYTPSVSPHSRGVAPVPDAHVDGEKMIVHDAMCFDGARAVAPRGQHRSNVP